MKNYELLVIKEAYRELRELSGNKGYYIPLVKNIKLVDIELEGLEAIKTKTEEFEKFLKEKEVLLRKYAKKDEHDNPVKVTEEVNGVSFVKYDIPEESKEEVDTLGKELIEKYKSAIDDMIAKEDEYLKAMNSECEVDFHKIKESDLPKEMSPELFEIILPFVENE